MEKGDRVVCLRDYNKPWFMSGDLPKKHEQYIVSESCEDGNGNSIISLEGVANSWMPSGASLFFNANAFLEYTKYLSEVEIPLEIFKRGKI